MGVKVSLEPAGNLLPLAQNNQHTTEAHLEVTSSELLRILLLSSVPWDGWNTICLIIHLWKDILVFPVFDYCKEGPYKQSCADFA